jgi:hypothetical protein
MLQPLAAVAAPGPDRVRPGQPHRAYEPDRRQEQAEQPRPVLALEDADQRQAGVDDQDAGGADPQRELGAADVGHPQRAEPGQGQPQAGGDQADRLD